MPRVLTFTVPPGKPVLRGNDRYWHVIRELDRIGPWTITDIHQRCGGGADRPSIRSFVERLVVGGYAVRDENGPNGVLYRLSKAPIATPCLRLDGTPGHQGRGQEAMWNVIRGPVGRNGFTAHELAMWASTASINVKATTALSYIRHLAQAGYFICLRKGGPGRPASYRLRADFDGAYPPLILRTKVVFDQNRGEVVGSVVAREVEP